MSPNVERLHALLLAALEADRVEIRDRTHLHANHRGRGEAPPDSGHYEVTIVAACFAGKTLLERHRMVYAALGEEMQTSIHALSIQALTPDAATPAVGNG